MKTKRNIRVAIRVLAVAATLSVAGVTALCNVAPLPVARKTLHLNKEAVEVKITGNKAKVSGTFRFDIISTWKHDGTYQLYLPVYAAEGVKPEAIQPNVAVEGLPGIVQLDMRPADKEQVPTIPTLKGQRPYWFIINLSLVSSGGQLYLLNNPEVIVKMSYEQDLADGAFIYTPLIPEQRPKKDYGTISLSGDKPLKLKNRASHDATEKEGKWIVRPYHKRSVIVETKEVSP